MSMGAYLRRFSLHRMADLIRKPVASMKRLAIHLDLLVYSMLLLLAAAGAATLALDNVGKAFDDGATGAGNKIEVQRVYLTRADYGAYLPTLARLNPGVGFALSQDGSSVLMTIGDEELFPDFLMALHTLQAFKPSVAWELVEMCAKKCSEEQVVASAIVKGFTQEIYKP